MRIVVPLVLLGVVGACGDDHGPGAVDASAMGDGGAEAPVPWLADGTPPIVLPVLTPCPMGWREVADPSGVAICEPYPEGGAADCPVGEVHFPGEPACAPVGATCPGGEFADGLPTDRRVVYVQAGASGGDGSAATPYGSVGEFALGPLPLGSVIALAKGEHVGSLQLVRGIALRGACAAETRVRTDVADPTEGIVSLRGTGHDVRDVTLADSPRPGIWARGAGIDGAFEGVVVSNTEGLAVGALGGAQLTLTTAVVRDTDSLSATGLFGRGLESNSGGSIVASRIVLERNRDHGASTSHAGSELLVSDVVIRDTEGRVSDRRWGNAFGADEGPTIRIERALVERNNLSGCFIGEAGSEGMLSDFIIRDTDGRDSDGFLGDGLAVQHDARVEARRMLIERSHDAGVYLGSENAHLTLEDAIVRDTAPRTPDMLFGRGINLQDVVTFDLARVVVERNRDVGIYAKTATGTIADLIVRTTESRVADLAGGRGLVIQEGSVVGIERVLLERSREIGLNGYGMGTQVDATDVAITGTVAAECAGTGCPFGNEVGVGVGSYVGAAMRLHRFVSRSSETCGIQVATDGEVDLSVGEVSGQPLGACVQVDGYDLGRLMMDVRYLENDTNLQATTLPVPEPEIARGD